MFIRFLKLLLLTCVLIAAVVTIWEIRNLERINRVGSIPPAFQETRPALIVATSTPFISPVITASATAFSTETPSPTVLPTTTLSFTEQLVIGYSVAGRPLNMYRFGTGPIHRVIIGGIHGGSEANTVQLTENLIAYLNANPNLIPAAVTLYILPALNVDGYERSSGSRGRANEHGVDINRNFNAFWALDWSREGCWNYGPISAGSAPDSEPETRALENFLTQNNIDALISYHSAALGIFPGGQPPDTDSVSLAEVLHAVSKYPYPPVDTGCVYTGQLIDWASLHNIAAVDIELFTHNELDYEINLKILKSFLNWTK